MRTLSANELSCAGCLYAACSSVDEQEPITPFIARVRDLYEKAGISTILVAGSSGAFFHVADTIIQMDAYRPKDVKAKVQELLPEYPSVDFKCNTEPFVLPSEKRMFEMERKAKRHGRGDREERIKTKVMGTDGFPLSIIWWICGMWSS